MDLLDEDSVKSLNSLKDNQAQQPPLSQSLQTRDGNTASDDNIAWPEDPME